MPPRLPPFAALRAFDAIGRRGGIRRAAEELGISHAIVSRHLSALEADLGQVLLDRATGTLTVPGNAYHTRISAAIRAMEEATAAQRSAAHGAAERGLVIWCSAGLSLHWLARRLPDFARGAGAQPGALVVDLRSTDNEPDFTRGEADGDIRYQLDSDPATPPRGIRTEELARPPVFPVAAPEVVARPPADLTALLALPLIQEGPLNEWRDWLAAQGGPPHALPAPAVRYAQAHLALAAARAGQGVALANPLLAAEDLATGRLVEITGFRRPALGAYTFRCSRSRWTQPQIQRFRQWLARSLAV